MATFLFYLLSIGAILVLLPLASQMSSAMHENRRRGTTGMQVLTSVFYTKKPQLVHEQESRQARKNYDEVEKNLSSDSDIIADEVLPPEAK